MPEESGTFNEVDLEKDKEVMYCSLREPGFWCSKFKRDCLGSCEWKREKLAMMRAKKVYMKIYDCKKEFCPHEGDRRFNKRPFEKHSHKCMFNNGLPEGKCCHSDNKQKGRVQKTMDKWM